MADTQIQERMRPTSVTLDADTKQLLSELARVEDRSRSQIMRRAVKLYAEARETT